MPGISAIVLTKNEEANLADCLQSLAWADELLVVDSFSTDETVAIAQAHGARVVQHAFVNYAAQRNYAQGIAAYDWVLHIDADERVTPALAAEIAELRDSAAISAHNAYYFARVDLWLGTWFPSSPAAYRLTPAIRRHLVRNRFIRFYDRRQGSWQRALHEVVVVPPPHGFLEGCITHFSATNLARMLEPFNSYTSIEASQLYAEGQRASVARAIYRGLRTALYLYFAWRLYRRGAPGLVIAMHQGYVKTMNYLKLWELERIAGERGEWTDQDRTLLHQVARTTDTQIRPAIGAHTDGVADQASHTDQADGANRSAPGDKGA